ncbi:hypothetical protein [Kribbella sp. HUAS MG21]|uniref:PPE family protein n=1 Tax=Kribbella sp. HUAS MG21 TaxID=3160966 RepID=A0AAU7THU8_9ACTN
MADYRNTSMADMVAQLNGVDAGVWLQAGETWSTAATTVRTTQDDLQRAWDSTVPAQQGELCVSFVHNLNMSRTSVDEWQPFIAGVGAQLTNIGNVTTDAKRIVGGLVQPYADAEHRHMTATDAAEGKAAQREMDDIRGCVANVMNNLSSLMEQALGRVTPVPHAKYGGPMTPKAATEPGAGDPSAGAPGAGDPSAAVDAGGGGATPGDLGGAPGETPAPSAPETPEAKDPVEEAGKLIDVIGKGIDLIGKVPENLDKWVTLAQNTQDLLGGDTTPDPDSVVPKGLNTDAPALAGSAGTEPILKPSNYTPSSPSSAGFGGGGLGSIGLPFAGGGGGGGGHTSLPSGTTERGTSSMRSATTAGGAGTEPTLAGRPSVTSTSTGAQSTMPPMYPPMGGAGAPGAAGRGEIKPGAAPSRPGFAVPTESTATERLRRQGVQSDLQGRTNGEQRTPTGAPPLRKRPAAARSRRTPTEDVLDEELWKL